jgi:dephospho-CoA kinase
LESSGWRILDTDAIVHELYRSGGAGSKIVVDAFGPSVLNEDQSVNRALLGQLVFSSAEKRHLLNSLIHPLVRTVWRQQLDEHLLREPSRPVAVVIPLLFETGAEAELGPVVCVGCSPQTQRERLAGRGWTPEEIARRTGSQWPLERKMELSQIVVWNDGSRELLAAQASRLSRI